MTDFTNEAAYAHDVVATVQPEELGLFFSTGGGEGRITFETSAEHSASSLNYYQPDGTLGVFVTDQTPEGRQALRALGQAIVDAVPAEAVEESAAVEISLPEARFVTYPSGIMPGLTILRDLEEGRDYPLAADSNPEKAASEVVEFGAPVGPDLSVRSSAADAVEGPDKVLTPVEVSA